MFGSHLSVVFSRCNEQLPRLDVFILVTMLIVIRLSGPTAFGTVAARLRPAPPSLESSDGPVLLYDDLADEIPDAADPRDVQVAELDVKGDQHGDQEGTHQFFKVLNPRPKMVKKISYDSGVNEGYRKDELTIALLDARWNEEHRTMIVSEPTMDLHLGCAGNNSPFTLPHVCVRELRSSIYQWQLQGWKVSPGELPAELENPAQCTELLMTMWRVAASKLPFTGHPGDEQEQSCLRSLSAAGLVQCKSQGEDGRGVWELTRKWLKQLKLSSVVSRPRAVMAVGADVPLAKMNEFELMDHIFSSGWDLVEAPNKPILKKHAPYSKESPKRFYCLKRKEGWSTPQRYYLLALADADAILDAGIQSIPHGGTRLYYKTLFEDRREQPTRGKRG